MAVPNGNETTAWFEWGTNATYGEVTTLTNIGNGMRVARLSAPIDGLANGGIYYYRLAASNAFGVQYGPQIRFSTGTKLQNWGNLSLGRAIVPTGLSNVVGIAAGHNQGLAWTSDGTPVAWPGSSVPIPTPEVPAGLSNIVAMAGGYSHCLALKEDGTVIAWGNYFTGGTSSVPAGLSNVIAIAAGDSHSLFLKSDGSVSRVGGSSLPSSLTNVVAIAAGSGHNIALRADGKVIAWGSDFGNPNPNPPPWLSNVVAISTETWHDLALRDNGTVVSWGYNNRGQTNVPIGLSNVLSVAAGFGYSLALKHDGTLVAWGDPAYVANVPVGLSNCIMIASGDNHSVGLSPENLVPRSLNQTKAGEVNKDLVIALPAYDANGDLLTFRVTPSAFPGKLYQYSGMGRGAPITSADTPVTNGSWVVFAPESGAMDAPYSQFSFVANDGLSDSALATLTVNILPRPVLNVATLVPGPNPHFLLGFAGFSNATYFVHASVNARNWIQLGTATQATPGQFLFRDYGVTNIGNRIYRLRSP